MGLGWGAAAGSGAGGGVCADGPGGRRRRAGRPPAEGGTIGSAAPACAWDVVAPELKLPEARAAGGAAREQPERLHHLHAAEGRPAVRRRSICCASTERTLVDLEVISDLDTVLAIRRACDDPLTEVACSDGRAGVATDAGLSSPMPASRVRRRVASSRDAHLRASLAAGTYYVLVDEAEPSGVGGSFQLRVRTIAPPAQTTCPAARRRSATAPGCWPRSWTWPARRRPAEAETARPALFYRACIPAGARITARALPDRRAIAPGRRRCSCSPAARPGRATCAWPRDRLTLDGQRELRYVNNGPTEQTVLLSVSATEPVTGARVPAGGGHRPAAGERHLRVGAAR